MTIYFIIYERFTNKYPCCFTIIPSVVSDVGKKKRRKGNSNNKNNGLNYYFIFL